MSDRPTILGIPFDATSLADAVARTQAALGGRTVFHVVTPGPEFLMTSRHHQRFAEVLRQADLSLPDGMGVIVAAKILGQAGLRRIPGMDFLDGLLRAAVSGGVAVFLYGAMPGVAEAAAKRLTKQYVGLKIAGIESGFRGWIRVPESFVAWRIRRSRAAVLLVALGAPEQELWIDRNRSQLGSVRVAMGVGGAFDFWSGQVARAPQLMQRLGLEWAWRLLQQPRQRWRRIVTATWSFMIAVLNEKRRSHA
ncbi:MAG: WecB/TagA/CpsF family glycosyltransferase [Candidatus Kerfeldbacteria bacterium]|nr:WecB/TagA/CpsF family glycosyltransferase [Candidatus Kerfeldbacteria bacterium]